MKDIDRGMAYRICLGAMAWNWEVYSIGTGEVLRRGDSVTEEGARTAASAAISTIPEAEIKRRLP